MLAKNPKIIYVAGSYRAATTAEILANCVRAWSVARQIWRLGHIAICPHANTFLMSEEPDPVPAENFLTGDLRLLAHCDALLLLPQSHRSEGSMGECRCARNLDLPIFHMDAEGELPFSLRDYLHNRHATNRHPARPCDDATPATSPWPANIGQRLPGDGSRDCDDPTFVCTEVDHEQKRVAFEEVAAAQFRSPDAIATVNRLISCLEDGGVDVDKLIFSEYFFGQIAESVGPQAISPASETSEAIPSFFSSCIWDGGHRKIPIGTFPERKRNIICLEITKRWVATHPFTLTREKKDDATPEQKLGMNPASAAANLGQAERDKRFNERWREGGTIDQEIERQFEVNAQGGKGSKLDTRCDLIDGRALLVLGRVHKEGIDHGYEEDNWRQVTQQEHLKHALHHLYQLQAGETDEDHLAHAFCRLCMAVGVREAAQAKAFFGVYTAMTTQKHLREMLSPRTADDPSRDDPKS